MLKIDKKSYKGIGIYSIGYITKKNWWLWKDFPLYLLISNANRCIERSSTEEKSINKYLVFDSTDQNKELLKKYNDVFNGIREKNKEINSDECDNEKDYMKT